MLRPFIGRYQVHFHLKTEQPKHLLLRPSPPLIQHPESISEASSVHPPPLPGHLGAHQTVTEAGPHQPLLSCQEPAELHSSRWLSTNKEIFRRVSELEGRKQPH